MVCWPPTINILMLAIITSISTYYYTDTGIGPSLINNRYKCVRKMSILLILITNSIKVLKIVWF